MNRPEIKQISTYHGQLEYIVFGRGQEPLIVLPGINDSLRPVQKQAASLAYQYKQFVENFRIYIFSRSSSLAQGTTTRQMAADQGLAMVQLGIAKAAVLGCSMGGMIAQYLAIDYPQLVGSLVLAVTTGGPTKALVAVLNHWITLAETGQGDQLTIDMFEKTFTAAQIDQYRPLYPMIQKINRPDSYDSFLIQARACMNHNALAELNQISQPTLVIGGTADEIVGKESLEQMAAIIPRARLISFENLGHGVQEETTEFNERVFEFFKENSNS